MKTILMMLLLGTSFAVLADTDTAGDLQLFLNTQPKIMKLLTEQKKKYNCEQYFTEIIQFNKEDLISTKNEMLNCLKDIKCNGIPGGKHLPDIERSSLSEDLKQIEFILSKMPKNVVKLYDGQLECGLEVGKHGISIRVGLTNEHEMILIHALKY